MKRIKIFLIIIFLFFLSFISLKIFNNSSIKSNINNKKNNLILISFDGLQAKHLNEYGYSKQTTPNLDNLLNQSTVFTKTVSPSSWTVPTHMSIFTSMYPSEHKVVNKYTDFNIETQKGIISNLKELSPNVKTFTEILKNNGYLTGGFTGDAGVGPQFGFNQGFDTYYETTGTFGGFEDSMPKAIEWLNQNKDKPFFLFLHGYDVHGQHTPNNGFDYRYVSNPYTGKYTGSKEEQSKLREKSLADGGHLDISDEDVSFWRAIYDEKINRMDIEFKNFMDQIKQMGLMDNSIIILMSDHGTEFYEHQSIDHGATLYSELINVLFAIHQPGQTQGKKIDQLVSTMDIFPTILDLLQIKNPVTEQTKGIDLTPVLTNDVDVAHDVFSETDYRLFTFKRSLTTKDGWKLIITLENGNKELYNLNDDPDEQKNLIQTNPQKAYELEQILEKHIDDISGERSSSQIGCSPVYGNQCKE